MSLISLEDVRKIYSLGDVEVRALDGVTFNVDKGEFIAVMGSSVSGNSTLMNILGCLDRPTSGRYFLNDVEVSRLGRGELANRERRAGRGDLHFAELGRDDPAGTVVTDGRRQDWPPDDVALLEKLEGWFA